MKFLNLFVLSLSFCFCFAALAVEPIDRRPSRELFRKKIRTLPLYELPLMEEMIIKRIDPEIIDSIIRNGKHFIDKGSFHIKGYFPERRPSPIEPSERERLKKEKEKLEKQLEEDSIAVFIHNNFLPLPDDPFDPDNKDLNPDDIRNLREMLNPMRMITKGGTEIILQPSLSLVKKIRNLDEDVLANIDEFGVDNALDFFELGQNQRQRDYVKLLKELIEKSKHNAKRWR